MSAERAVLVIGYPADPTIQHTLRHFERRGVRHTLLDIAEYLSVGVVVHAGYPSLPRIVLDDDVVDVMSYSGVYVRFLHLTHHSKLPLEVRRLVNQKLITLESMLDVAPVRVVNRPSKDGGNSVKALQLRRLQRYGFEVPATWSTNLADAPGLAERLAAGEVVFKSNSSIRSIVHRASRDDVRKLDLLPNCPALFQRYVEGPDVRVHMVGDRAIGLEIRSEATDYRYPLGPGTVSYRPVDVPPEIVARCARFLDEQELSFVGFDFKVDGSGRWLCLEANPMPGYDGFDRHLDGAIGDALIDAL